MGSSIESVRFALFLITAFTMHNILDFQILLFVGALNRVRTFANTIISLLKHSAFRYDS